MRRPPHPELQSLASFGFSPAQPAAVPAYSQGSFNSYLSYQTMTNAPYYGPVSFDTTLGYSGYPYAAAAAVAAQTQGVVLDDAPYSVVQNPQGVSYSPYFFPGQC